jgi:tetratricopeptide (TPR) repeat protein
MNLNRRRTLFHEKRRSNLYRMFAWALVILAGIWIISEVKTGAITPLFLPTPTPTRMAQSYALEGDAFFTAGKLEAAILAYQDAIDTDPANVETYTKLARIQTYSSSLLTTDTEKQQRLAEALQTIDQAIALAPDDSNAHAIRSFVLDWSASAATTDAEGQSLLLEADRAATRARQLDNQNVLAQAFYAEILVDEQKWAQAEQVILGAIERGPDLMDVHRVYAYVLESTGQYRQAIEEYQRALEINPNLTFLYISVGYNYRILAYKSDITSQRDQLYEQALEFFAKAANLNKQLVIKDPIPYIAIAKTYSQKGDFFAAALNIKQALEFDPSNAGIYGQLGVIYFQARNYESSIPVLKCAIRGCTPEESCLARYDQACDAEQDQVGVSVTGLDLTDSTVVYYYTYGSVLAAFGPREPDYCTEAVSVLNQVQTAYSGDPTISSIVADGLAVCSLVNQQQLQVSTPVPTPTLLPTPRP